MEQFGRYQLIRRLAQGGMAEIFLASTVSVEGFEKQVIIKKMLAKWSKDKNFVDKFIDEAKISSKLHHANIVQVFDFGLHDDHYYLALEYVSGADLSQIIKSNRAHHTHISIGLVCYIIEQVLAGLDYAHEYHEPGCNPLRLVHRDMSPSNILLSLRGEVKIGDFGIVKAQDRMSITEPGAVLGKLSYMSPEQARGEPLDGRSDIYSVGLVLFELLTNIRVTQLVDKKDLPHFVQHPVLPCASQYRTDLDPDLITLLARATAPDLAKRFATCNEFLEALQAYRVKYDHFANALSLSRYLERLLKLGLPVKKGADPNAPEFNNQATVAEKSIVFASNFDPASLDLEPDTTGHQSPCESDSNSVWQACVAPFLESIMQTPQPAFLIEAGDALIKINDKPRAYYLYFLAATKWMQQGFLFMALWAYQKMSQCLVSESQFQADVSFCQAQKGCSSQAILAHFVWQEPFIDSVVKSCLFGATQAQSLVCIKEPDIMTHLPVPELLLLARSMQPVHYPAGTFLVKQDSLAPGLILLTKGRVMVSYETPEHTHQSLDSLMFGEVLGESSLLATPSHRHFVAFDDVDGFLLAADSLIAKRQQLPTFFSYVEKKQQHYRAEIWLSTHSPFSLLSNKDKQRLLQTMQYFAYKNNDLLVNENSTSDHIYVLTHGSVQAVSTCLNHTQIVIADQCFGDIAAVLRVSRTHAVRVYTDQALGFMLSGTVLWKILRKDTQTQHVFNQFVHQRMQQHWPS